MIELYRLLGDLGQLAVFSYQLLLQRIVARGILESDQKHQEKKVVE